MKKKYLLFLITFFYLLIADDMVAVPCLPDGISFTTQEQIDNFATDYPGCTEILGTVYINGGDGVNNLPQ